MCISSSIKCALVVALACGALATRDAAAQTATATVGAGEYEVVSLAAEGESTSTPKGVSDDGAVLGNFAESGTGWFHQFVLRDGVRTLLEDRAAVGPHFSAYSIEADDAVLGLIKVDDIDHISRFRDGTLEDLGVAGPKHCKVIGIGAGGVGLGWWPEIPTGSARGTTHAYLVQGGLRVDLPGIDNYGCQAFARNAHGAVVGEATGARGEAHPVLWERGSEEQAWRVTDLSPPGSYSSEAFAINDAGAIVGCAVPPHGEVHGILWERVGSKGELLPRDLGTLGGSQSMAVAINADGWIAGWVRQKDGALHAVVWARTAGGSGRRGIDLGALLGTAGHDSEAVAINARGDVVGWMEGEKISRRHAVLWRHKPAPTTGDASGK